MHQHVPRLDPLRDRAHGSLVGEVDGELTCAVEDFHLVSAGLQRPHNGAADTADTAGTARHHG